MRRPPKCETPCWHFRSNELSHGTNRAASDMTTNHRLVHVVKLVPYAPLQQVAYSPNDEVLASAGYDQAVKVWDCRSRSWEPIQTMRVFADSVTSVTVTDKCAESLTSPQPIASRTVRLSPFCRRWPAFFHQRAVSMAACISPTML